MGNLLDPWIENCPLSLHAGQTLIQGNKYDTLILLMFRHALRVSEVIALRWEQVDLKKGLLHVNRRKNGLPSTHPLRGIELRALRQLQRQHDQANYVFYQKDKHP